MIGRRYFHVMHTYLLEVLVTVDVLLVVRVLQLVGFDVLPQGLDDAGAGLSVNAQEASQAGVQLELRGLRRRRSRIRTLIASRLFNDSTPQGPAHLVVQHQQQSAANADVSGTLHLEAVRLLRGGCAVPLNPKPQHRMFNSLAQGWAFCILFIIVGFSLCSVLISTLTAGAHLRFDCEFHLH